MEGVEMTNYANEEPRRNEEFNADHAASERRLGRWLVLGFGLLCVVQATLNLSLRLALSSSEDSAQTGCNATRNHDKDCGLEGPDHCNTLREKYAALVKDRETLENRNGLLADTIKSVTEERERLKMKLREVSGCTTSQPCPPGWKEISSRCYFISAQNKTWQDSREDCQSRGADLMISGSEQEQIDLAGDQPFVFWIGLREVNGVVKWVDDSEPTETFWKSSARGVPASVPFCVVMDCSVGTLQNWDRVSCDMKHHWLCEKDVCTVS